MGAEYKGPHFVGIFEHHFSSARATEGHSNYTYCVSQRPQNRDERLVQGVGHNIKRLGFEVASRYGQGFREHITYDVPEPNVWAQDSENPGRFHSLSVIERETFERAVLEKLEKDTK